MENVEDEFKKIVEHDLSDVNSIQSIAQMLVELKAQMHELAPIIERLLSKRMRLVSRRKKFRNNYSNWLSKSTLLIPQYGSRARK